MKSVNAQKLTELTRAAQNSPRRRTNFNLHERLDDPIQRLCITGEPDTVFPPHRHLDKWELVIALKGRFSLFIYDENGTIREQFELAPGGMDVSAVEIPEGTWHNCVFHESGTTFLEVKKGPYTPLRPEDMATFPGVGPKK